MGEARRRRKQAYLPPPAHVEAPLIAEINLLERAYLGYSADPNEPLGAATGEYLANSDAGEKAVHVVELLIAMDVAWASGQRTLLLSVDSGGGSFSAGVLLHDALRVWRLAGGHAVVFVSGLAASTMSWAILAADLVVAAPGSRFVAHGPSQSLSETATDWKRAIYRTATRAPAALVERWVTTPSHPDGTGAVYLSPQRALELGFADHIGDYDRARECAQALASRGDGSQGAINELQAALRGGFAKELTGLHETAMRLRRTMQVEWDTRTEIGVAVIESVQEARARLAAAVSKAQLQEAE
jgi:ATP-dependent protease ClpP protease subunit